MLGPKAYVKIDTLVAESLRETLSVHLTSVESLVLSSLMLELRRVEMAVIGDMIPVAIQNLKYSLLDELRDRP